MVSQNFKSQIPNLHEFFDKDVILTGKKGLIENQNLGIRETMW